MPVRARLVLAVLILPAALAAVSIAAAGSASPRAGSGSAQELVYVANDSGPVGIYHAGSAGRVHPVRTISDPGLNGTYWDPWTVAVDSASNLYVQGFLSEATTFVFHLSRTARLTRVFAVASPDSQSIAVDAHGYEYVMNGQGVPDIYVAAPHANGRPQDSYVVNPVREFSIAQTDFEPWPSTLAIDNHGDLLVAEVSSTGNLIEVYRGGPSGSDKPIRTISGPRTGLGSCAGFGACDQLSIAYSALTGRIYVAVSTRTGAHISVFAGRANGNVRPVRTIAGSRTGLTGKVITGIAGSQLTGDIYVMAKGAEFLAPGSIEVFARLANGNARPLRKFTDSATRFTEGQGIAIAS
jgi:hypothetical protein